MSKIEPHNYTVLELIGHIYLLDIQLVDEV